MTAKTGQISFWLGTLLAFQIGRIFQTNGQRSLENLAFVISKVIESGRILRDLEPDERERRLGNFGHLIRKHVLYGLEYSVSYDDYRWFIKRAKKQGRTVECRFGRPYSLGFGLLIGQIGVIEMTRRTFERVQCVFDSGIDKRRLLEREYKQSVALLPLSVRERFMPEPVFGDDMEFMPLQAADLRAWYSHRSLGSETRAVGALWKELEEIAHFQHRWTRQNLANALDANRRFGTKGLHRMFLAHINKLEGKGVRLPSGKVII